MHLDLLLSEACASYLHGKHDYFNRPTNRASREDAILVMEIPYLTFNVDYMNYNSSKALSLGSSSSSSPGTRLGFSKASPADLFKL
jgi:hypothetical protein